MGLFGPSVYIQDVDLANIGRLILGLRGFSSRSA